MACLFSSTQVRLLWHTSSGEVSDNIMLRLDEEIPHSTSCYVYAIVDSGRVDRFDYCLHSLKHYSLRMSETQNDGSGWSKFLVDPSERNLTLNI